MIAARATGTPVPQEEVIPKSINGMPVLLINILFMLGALAAVILGIMEPAISAIVAGSVYLLIIGPLFFIGLKVVGPNEALALTLFGRYYGTLRGEGLFFVNPFVIAINPARKPVSHPVAAHVALGSTQPAISMPDKRISLKAITLNNDKAKNKRRRTFVQLTGRLNIY